MNALFLMIDIVFVFSCVLLVNRFFAKDGLIAWIAIASILANIMTAKNAEIAGVSFTVGTVLFASTFLATDVLSELYGKKAAIKAVFVGAFATITLIVSSQIALLYIPSAFDTAHEAMARLFALSFRISVASVVMYLVANVADVCIYEKLREKTGGKMMWLRNNVSTIVCNCLENFAFMGLAFVGVFAAKEILEMAIATSAVEAFAGLCDTPFLYIATRKR